MKREIDLLRFPHIDRELGSRTEAHRVIARRFDREFFDGSRDTGYGGYADDGRWQAVALRMMLHYGLKPGDRVLDIGCAKGFLVRDLRALGLDALGIDISEYAISKSVVSPYTLAMDVLEIGYWSLPGSGKSFNLVVSINTLHNLERKRLAEVLSWLRRLSIRQYITVDAWRNEEQRLRMEAWNLTAKTMMSVADWKAFFDQVGYQGDYWWFMP